MPAAMQTANRRPHDCHTKSGLKPSVKSCRLPTVDTYCTVLYTVLEANTRLILHARLLYAGHPIQKMVDEIHSMMWLQLKLETLSLSFLTPGFVVAGINHDKL